MNTQEIVNNQQPTKSQVMKTTSDLIFLIPGTILRWEKFCHSIADEILFCELLYIAQETRALVWWVVFVFFADLGKQ